MLAQNGALADHGRGRARAFSNAPAAPASAWDRLPTTDARLAAHLQPQLLRTQRNGRRQGLPGQPRDGRRLRHDGRMSPTRRRSPLPAPTLRPRQVFRSTTTWWRLPARGRMRARWRSCAARTSSPSPPAPPAESKSTARSCIKVERQHHHRPHHALHGGKLLPYRSNIPHLANYCLDALRPRFPRTRQGSRAAALSWAAPTTARAPAASTRRLPRSTWASRAVLAKILCPHPCGKPHQQRHPSPGV